MPSFRKNKNPIKAGKQQAATVMKRIQGSVLRSVGTVRNYEEALSRVAQFTNREFGCRLQELSPKQAIQYLETRSEEVGQKTLDMERQAIQAMMRHVTGKLPPDGATLTVVKSAFKQIKESRAYTPEQVAMIANGQIERNALATEIAHAAGLRSHELFTLRPAAERNADERPALDTKWLEREGKLYTVIGKGGLCREVLLPSTLAARLESCRLAAPVKVTDRGIDYIQHYGINAGQCWSTSFSDASKRVLGWTTGSHGVRHSYAQERMRELKRIRLTRDVALKTVSQEMGHFRPEITETYLR
ncbi:site-specific integrase [Agarivorans sp. B2Z047]|uniref:site-specific integrase n=1 Tax=Agarivorans sp. B2Z047 TaxID=2652721 RepID=UPI00128CBDFF|nr:site-specific integrase [Agarivorans sp. B2Z047]MPW28251.1 site-specific integrase [Agarivorans sp. B2Z047]UQN43921.1 site-specific integrase [Agarivorans sp. B2Z047]